MVRRHKFNKDSLSAQVQGTNDPLAATRQKAFLAEAFSSYVAGKITHRLNPNPESTPATRKTKH
jgi:hypothetical protein